MRYFFLCALALLTGMACKSSLTGQYATRAAAGGALLEATQLTLTRDSFQYSNDNSCEMTVATGTGTYRTQHDTLVLQFAPPPTHYYNNYTATAVPMEGRMAAFRVWVAPDLFLPADNLVFDYLAIHLRYVVNEEWKELRDTLRVQEEVYTIVLPPGSTCYSVALTAYALQDGVSLPQGHIGHLFPDWPGASIQVYALSRPGEAQLGPRATRAFRIRRSLFGVPRLQSLRTESYLYKQ